MTDRSEYFTIRDDWALEVALAKDEAEEAAVGDD